jgi:hypothetical protein
MNELMIALAILRKAPTLVATKKCVAEINTCVELGVNSRDEPTKADESYLLQKCMLDTPGWTATFRELYEGKMKALKAK